MRTTLKGICCLTVAAFFLQTGNLAQSARVHANAIQLVSPSNQTVTGTFNFSVSGDLSAVASVEYKMGNYRIALSSESPFNVAWNSALAADGNIQVETIARDAFGKIISDMFAPLVFLNYGNKTEILKGGLPARLTGNVPMTIHGYDSVHFPAFWNVSIDGEQLPPIYTDHFSTHDVTITPTLDTTIYPNGSHEFYVTFHSNDFGVANPPPGSTDYRGMIMQTVDIENGRTFMEVVANYLHVYTPVGGTVALQCSRAYTNGDRGACQASKWSSADTTVVTVDADGTLRGIAEGYTDVTLTEGSKTTIVRVWVKNDPGLPHFTTNGAMSSTYVDGKSTFIVTPFVLSPNYLAADPQLLAETRRAGINTLTTGMYVNANSTTMTYSDWLSSYNANILPNLQFSVANGFRVLGTGDNIMRGIGAEAYRTLNWPPAKQAVQYAFQQFANSGTAVSVEMIDEAGFTWGPNPTPPGLLGAMNSMQSVTCSGSLCTVTWPNLADNSHHDTISNGLTFIITGNPAINTPLGSYYTAQNATATTFTFVPATPVTGTFSPQTNSSTEFQWFARSNTCSGTPCAPPVLNTAIATITGWAKSASPTVALSYPPGGIEPASAQRDWTGVGSISDYASHYWDTFQLRPTYVFGKGIRETGFNMLYIYYGRERYMQVNRPQIMEISVSGTSFFKYSAAGVDSYNPPTDILYHTGNVPKTTASSMFSAAAAGISGLRMYQFETPEEYQAQKQNSSGGQYSPAAAPFYGETNLWRAMGYAANLMTKVLQPYLLSAPGNSPALGRNFITGVRKSSLGTMLIVVNGWDDARQVTLDFTPYKSGFGSIRYKVNDTYIKTAVLKDSAGETVMMESGETLIYIFPNVDGPSGLDSIVFSQGRMAGSTKMSVTYGYIYQQNVAGFGDSVECTRGCSITVDRSLGDVFFQTTMIPAGGSPQPSAVQMLGRVKTISLPATQLARANGGRR